MLTKKTLLIAASSVTALAGAGAMVAGVTFGFFSSHHGNLLRRTHFTAGDRDALAGRHSYLHAVGPTSPWRRNGCLAEVPAITPPRFSARSPSLYGGKRPGLHRS